MTRPLLRNLLVPPEGDGGNDAVFEFSRNCKVLTCFKLFTEKKFELPLGLLLAWTTTFKATQPADRIFALLGLSSDDTDSIVKPDYTTPVLEIFRKTAQNLLVSSTNAPFILPSAGIGYLRKILPTILQLPTWAPDWTSERVGVALTHFQPPELKEYLSVQSGSPQIPVKRIEYSASGDSKPQICLGHVFGALQMSGIRLDTIKQLSSAFEGPLKPTSMAFKEQMYDEGVRWRRESLTLANTFAKEPYPSASASLPRREAFWRTIIADRTMEEWPAPDCFGEYYGWWEVLQDECSLDEEEKNGAVSELLQRFAAGMGPDDSEGVLKTQKAQKRDMPVTSSQLNTFKEMNKKFDTQVRQAAWGRKFRVTETGYIGLVPPRSEVGGTLCLIFGMQTPYLLRSSITAEEVAEPRTPLHLLVGECYIHGMMAGELMDETKAEDFMII